MRVINDFIKGIADYRLQIADWQIAKYKLDFIKL